MINFDRNCLRLYAVTDRSWLGDETLYTQVEKALKGGATMIQIREKELDLARIQEMPGIVGYLVQEGDTLWDIARDCLTTPEKIREWNQLGTEEALPGTRLLILKNIPSSRS